MQISDKVYVGSLNKLLNYLIVIAVFTIAGSFFYFNNIKHQQLAQEANKRAKLNVPDVDKVVNKYMQQANNENELYKIKLEKAMLEARKKVQADIEASKLKQDKEIQQIPLEKQIWKEADMQAQLNKVNSQLPKSKGTKKNTESGELEIDIKKLTPEEKAEYARQYIENARKGGYYIELDDNMQVIKSTPIRKPSQQNDSINGAQTD